MRPTPAKAGLLEPSTIYRIKELEAFGAGGWVFFGVVFVVGIGQQLGKGVDLGVGLIEHPLFLLAGSEDFFGDIEGGENGDVERRAIADGDGGLTFQEVTDKLNRVPCFCVLRADGSLAPISADDGTAVHTWYLDPAEAREALELMAAAAADELDGEELSLGVTAMGTVFEMAGGWTGTPGEADAAGAAPDPSALPQRFGFLPLPKDLDVQPGDGLGTILPGETLQRALPGECVT